MKFTMRSSLITAVLSFAFTNGIAYADSIAASLFSPLAPSGSVLTPIDLTGIAVPSNSTITAADYTVTFATAANQGVVRGAAAALHAIPVGGATGKTPLFLTGDYGSSLTSSAAASGNYLSTGVGSITITFAKPQSSLAVLWGSIDQGNSLTFNDAAGFKVTGTDAQNAAAGFISNGFQGPGGSAYLVIDTSTPFTSVTAASSVTSFEFAAVAGDTGLFILPTPEPSSVDLLAIGMLMAGLIGCMRRRIVRKVLSFIVQNGGCVNTISEQQNDPSARASTCNESPKAVALI